MLQKELIFSEDQTIASASTVVSTNVLKFPDLEDAFQNAITPNQGESGRLFWTVLLKTASPPAELKVIYSSYTAADIENGIQHFEIKIPANSPAGSKFVIPLIAGTLQQYQGVLYFSGDATSFDVSSWLSLEHETPTT